MSILFNFSSRIPCIFIVVNSPLFILQHLKELITHLSKSYRVYVITGNDLYSLDSCLNCIVIQIPISRKASVYDPFSVLSLAFLRLCFLPRLVISFTPKGGLLNLFSFPFPGKSIHYFTGQRWSTLSGFMRFFLITIDRLICLTMRLTLCDSHSQALYIHQCLSVKRPKVILHGSIRGVDHSFWRPASSLKLSYTLDLFPSLDFITHNRITPPLIFGFVGRICVDKGINILLQAFIAHLSSFPDSKLILVGPVEDKTRILSLLDSYPDSIYHVDYTSNVNLLLPFFSTLVLPSFREGFGSVVLEAAACKVPSIVSNIPGPIDFVVHNSTGFVVPPNDSTKLLQIFDYIGLNYSCLTPLGEAAYRKSYKYFKSSSVTSHLASYLTNYIIS